MIGIIDYRAGNLTSVARALRYLGQSCEVSGDPAVLDRASRLIFPGVGAAGEAMAHLRQGGLDRWLSRRLADGTPLLGICLGTQVIFERSEEDDTPCLGLVPGNVRRFPAGLADSGGPLKIPHMGWNTVSFAEHPVFRDLPGGAEFYFVHSYYPVPAERRWVIGETDYGIRFCAALARGNLVAVQFHPEKSGRPGLTILENFCRWGGEYAQ
jgi:imidazole glycerol-phosphate synthase subunit HisH